MVDEKTSLAEKHIRDANRWAIAIILFAILVAGANVFALIFEPAAAARGEIAKRIVRP